MDRPTEVQNELDELRNRGIAKLLNKHFTDTTAKLAKEKAENDAALADLEQRRANTSEFVPSTGGTLNPYDSMYVELQEKRAESRRKERETLLLYQRYVHKFGNTGNVTVPKVSASSPSSSVTAQERPPPPSPIPMNAPLQSLDEDDEESRRESIGPSPVPAFEEDNFDEIPPVPEESEATSMPEDTKPAPVEPVTPVESETPALPACMEENTLVSDSQVSEPESVFETSSKLKKEASKPDPAMDVIESADASAFEQQPSEPTEKTQAASETSHTSEDRPTKEVVAELPPATPVTNYEDDADDLSVISGLTTVNSATTRKVMEDLEIELDTFIKTETENIKKMMEMEDNMSRSSVDNHSIGDESHQVAIRAEAMAKQMQKILDDFKDDPSVVAATIVEEDETTQATSKYPQPYETANSQEEWMVHWDGSYKKEYYHEVHSNRTQWDPPASSSSSNPQDETDNFSHSDVMPEANEARSTRRLSRKDSYRKRRRRRRVRRYVALSFVLCCVGLVALNWKQNYPEKTFQEAAGAMLDDTKSLSWEAVKNQIEYAVTDRREREQEETEKTRQATELKRRQVELKQQAELKVKEEAERLAAAERKRLGNIAAKLKAQEEAHQGELEKKKKLAEEQLKRKLEEDSKRHELERRAVEETERQAEAERMAKEEELKSYRPWKCNVPVLSYVDERCRAYSKAHPTYNDTDLARFFVE